MSTTSHAHGPPPFRLHAVLFDFDGTLTRPGALDFAGLKRKIGCPPGHFVLEWIESLPTGERKAEALTTLDHFELAGAATSEPNAGAEDLVRRLRARGLAVGVLTRNGRAAVEQALHRFSTLSLDDFDVVVTRDDGLAPKPSPDGVVHAAEAMGAMPGDTLVVGDYLLDMQAGRAAGAVTAYLTNGTSLDADSVTSVAAGGVADVDDLGRFDAVECDFVIANLDELEDIVRLGLPLAPGKLPNDLLAGHLARVATGDSALLVPPAVGEDVAALHLGGAEVLVAHGDPITLGGDELARSAVLVNANDIAASGADLRWLIATVLLPPKTSASEALALLGDLERTAAEAGAVVVGGHTEITTAVVRPVVSLTALGTLARADLRDKRGVGRGDRIVLTKALAFEGTALLAAELGERLTALGMSDAELDACRALLSQASIVPEACVARRFRGVRAMHDVTEGGLATALRELAASTGHAMVADPISVPISAPTRRVCDLLGADPLGLIASGSLLICCCPESVDELLAALREKDIAATDIGEIGSPGAGVTAPRYCLAAPWPEFAADEAARLLAGAKPNRA